MVEAYSQEYTYKHPWERITSASWRKFADPENKHTLSHILQVDTLNQKLEPETGKLYTTRTITIYAPGPWYVTGIRNCMCLDQVLGGYRGRIHHQEPVDGANATKCEASGWSCCY
ncbi:hypothetical protein SSX86_006274 [Deinandra increscens subsp. villosa]|uniref:PRELI/MSF1 domain-containing protein n=1 Tax=Deinandra increscens subsp. villosa TaxID=3103831 RepID=A0AAP0H8G8_9ASTR